MKSIKLAICMLIMLISHKHYGQMSWYDSVEVRGLNSEDTWAWFCNWSYQEVRDNSYKKIFEKRSAAPAPEGSSAMHKKYVHKVVFSKEPIIYGKEQESKFTTEFKYGDNIYAMAYYSMPVKRLGQYMMLRSRLYPGGTVQKYDVRMGDKYKSNHFAGLDEMADTLAYKAFPVVKAPVNGSDWRFVQGMYDYFETVLGLTESSQPQEFFIAMLDNNEAFGRFTYDLSGAKTGDFAALKPKLEKAGKIHDEKEKETAIYNKPMPSEWAAKSNTPGPGLTIAQLKAEYQNEKPDAVIVKVHITGKQAPRWNIAKNSLGVPRYKYLSEKVIFFYKIDGMCRMQETTVKRDYEGGGVYGDIYLGSFDPESLPCHKMK